jgi:hypothetical protein
VARTETKRFSPHDFRSFFQTALENAGVNSNIIAPLLAHKAKGIDQHYSDHDISDLMNKFKQLLPFLLPQTVAKVKSDLDITKAELTETEKKLNDLEDRRRRINNNNFFKFFLF